MVETAYQHGVNCPESTVCAPTHDNRLFKPNDNILNAHQRIAHGYYRVAGRLMAYGRGIALQPLEKLLIILGASGSDPGA